jgi:hypothetical protein
MRLKHDFIEDNLSRKDLAKKYVKFLNDLKGNHTIALDAPWGSGKSKFIEFMCEEFDSEDKKTKDVFIVYNAWENDYTDDPFLSLMSDFFSQIINKQYVGEDKLKGLMAKTFSASKVLGKGVFKGLIKNFLESDEVESLSDELNNIVNNTVETTSNELINKAFKDIENSKKTRKQFTEELKYTVKKILDEKRKDKFIIIIDELDRCKPTFAIELLENIKHLFEIKEIVFFIAIDKMQLAESIKSVYGSGFDSFTYLHRFVDLEIHLPKANLFKHFKKILTDRFDLEVYSDELEGYLKKSIILFDLTLRDFERILSETLLILIMNAGKYNIHIDICILLLILRYKEPDVYDIIFENRNVKYHEIQEKIKLEINSQNLNSFMITDAKILKYGEGEKVDNLKDETKKIFELIESTL